VEDAGGEVVGWAEAGAVDGAAHLHQVSVRPECERAGIGTALLLEVVEWASGRGFPSVSLTTFRDVPFNAPWYQRRGFLVLGDDELGPELAAIRAYERARGLDVAPRVAMRRSTLSFRPVTRADLGRLSEWAQTPHVGRWWKDPVTVAEFEVGAIGIDYFIGEPTLIGRGIGTRMIGEFISTVIRRHHPRVEKVIADPEVGNTASCRALEKNGFVKAKVFDGKYGNEQLMVLDLTAAVGGGGHRSVRT
jgi:RimJ/RimL family protein N-acetyltransferase/N-acetylglutamate synthase-like GNAT family acetyltransferase